MAVLAVLNVASTETATDSINVTLTVTPAAATLIGSATVTVFGEVLDLENARLQYSYMAYQTYTTATGGTGLAQTQGTSDWISISEVSKDFPNVSTSATISSSSTEGNVVFDIATTINYTATTPELHTVTTE
ncbi:hypothetical protein [Anaerovorax sp. IOR16]|uniref:hypothetical protein n=1 Tax=Anaerovorax sp. IOR16 TaxID=2773458 RepID=UPI0019D2E11B|nr:hypothetical protein [Anaerovorax sp. IOR16]